MLPLVPAEQISRWERVKSLVLDSVRSPHSKRAYGRALEDFAGWIQGQGIAGFNKAEFGKATVQRYVASLAEAGRAPSSINVRLAAIRKLAVEAADNGLLDPLLAAAIGRVKGATQKGRRLGRWLTRDEASRLLRDHVATSSPEAGPGGPAQTRRSAPQDTDPAETPPPLHFALKRTRDRAILCLLIGSGLRREELAGLCVEQIQQRDGRWVILDLVGKRQRIRTVPIPAWAKTAVDRWAEAAKITGGRLFRSLDKTGRVTAHRLSAQAVYLVVREQALANGLELSPHDARRTFAKLAHQGGVPLEQIQLSLGHESILTTEKYLGIRQDLIDAPCDHLGLDLR